MSFFTEPNPDNTAAPEEISLGPKLGALDSFQRAYDASARTQSQFGLESAFRDVEQSQIDKVRKAGGTPHPSLNDSEIVGPEQGIVDPDGYSTGFAPGLNSRRYLEAARFFQEGGTPEQSNFIAERNRSIDNLKQQFPELDLKSYDEMWDQVRQRAQQASKDWDQRNTTIPGMIGGFLGSSAAAVDPTVNPIGTATTLLPGGLGAKAAIRIGEQAALQGGAAALAEPGVQENRALLGLEHGFGQGAMSVLGAAAGGALFQGVGEGFHAVGRRWFRNVPHDPSPPPPTGEPTTVDPAKGVVLPPDGSTATPGAPIDAASRPEQLSGYDAFYQMVQDAGKDVFGPSRLAQRKTILEMDNVKAQLDDWRGPQPGELTPHTDTAAGRYAETIKFDNFNPTTRDIETRARAADPETFGQWDKLQAQMAEARADIARSGPAQSQDEVLRVRDALDTIGQTIETKTQQLESLKGNKLRRAQQEIEDLQAQRAEMAKNDTSARGEQRARLITLDNASRDLGPLMARARSTARNEWYERAPSAEGPPPALVTAPHPQDVYPSLFEGAERLPNFDRSAPASDQLSALFEQRAKELEPHVEKNVQEIRTLAKAVEEKRINPEKDSEKLTEQMQAIRDRYGDGLDKMVRTEADGTLRKLTPQEYAEEFAKDLEAAESVGTCSRG